MESLERIAGQLRSAGARLPVVTDGTIESAITTGLSIALCLIEMELSAGKLTSPANTIRILDTRLSAREKNCLLAEGINTIGNLINWSAVDLLKTPNIGKIGLQSIERELASHNLSLSPTLGSGLRRS
jgi:DNA-directed RNA polymerase alpha subunit